MLRDAAAVVTVATHMVARAIERLPDRSRPPLHLIPNGYDEEDFQSPPARELPRFSIVHTGQLRRGPRPLWEALARVIRERPALAGQLHFWQIGFVDARAASELDAPPEGVIVHVVPPVPQRDAIGYMMGADLLLVEEFGPVMPSKTPQYLRAGRPILGLVESGSELRETLSIVPYAHAVPRDDIAAIAALIAGLAAAPRAAPQAPPDAVVALSRRSIAARFAEVLEAACERHAARPVHHGRAPHGPRLAGAAVRAARP